MAAQLPFHPKPNTLALGIFLALYPLAALTAQAESQYSCTVGAGGQWLCVSQDSPRSIPRPDTAAAAARTETAAIPAAHTVPAKVAAQQQVTQAKGYALASRTPDFSHLDWVPRERLTGKQLAEIAPYCRGQYIEPMRLGKYDTTPLSQAPIYVKAIDSQHYQQTQLTELSGDVTIRQASLHAEAEHAQMDQVSNLGILTGNVRLRDQDMLIVGDKATIQLDTGEAQIENAEYVIHTMAARGGAEYIKRNEDGIVRLKSGSYTSCTPDRNDWHLHSNNITLNQDTGFGTATNATLRVKNIPVLYTPYIHFPIDDRRQSGFLPPSISYSDSKGVDITTPYYFNLAPNFDATLYPNYISKRGLLTEAEFRYLTKKSEGQIGGAWLGNDKEDEREQQSEYKKDRWMVNLQHQHGFNSRLLAEIDYTDISDPYYFQDLSSNIVESSSTTVDQRAGLTWRGNSYTARLNVHAYERANITDVTPYDKLPQLTLEGSAPWELAGLQLSYKTEWVKFDRSLKKGDYFNKDGIPERWVDDNLSGLNRANGDRLHLEPNLSLPMNWAWGFLKPGVKLAYTKYDLDLDRQGKATLNRDFDKTPTRTVPIYSVDSGLYFDRPTQLFGKSYTQTLEPRLFYLYVPHEDQRDIPLFDTSESSFTYETLFRDNRFSGRDRIGDTNQISLGLTWRWLEDSGFERQRLAVGQAYYLSDRKVMLDAIEKDAYKDYDPNTSTRSPYAGQYMYRFNRDWSLNANLTWDPSTSSTRNGSLMFQYQPAANLNKIINFGYRYRNDDVIFDRELGRYITGSRDYIEKNPDGSVKKVHEDFYKIEQTDFSIMWPIFTRWNAIARWQYDYNQNRTLEALGGFEYNNCCWKIRLVNRYWIDYDEHSMTPMDNREPDRGIFLQIILKGLGGITGNKVNTFLEEGIPGYQRREENAY